MSSKNSRTKNLTVRFITDAAKGIKNARMFKNELKDINNVASQSKKDGGVFNTLLGGQGGLKQIPTVGSMLNNLKMKVLNLKPAFIAGAAALAIFTAGMGQMVNAGRQTEDAITKLYVMHGKNRRQALEDYNAALKYSVATPFDPREVVEGSKVLTAYGAEKFGDKKQFLKLVGDMAAYSGQTMEQSATALMRGDLALLDKYGLQGRQAYSAAKKKGALGTEGFQAEFIKQMSNAKNLWNGMAQEMAGTVSGLFSTIAGNAGLIWTYLSGAAEGQESLTFWNSLKSILKDISDGFSDFVEMMKPIFIDIGGAIGGVFDAVWSALKSIFAIIKPIASIVGGVLYGAFRGILKAIIYIARGIKWVFDGITKGVKWLYNKLDSFFGISEKLGKVVKWFENAIGLLKGLWVFVMELIDPAIQKIKELFQWLMKSLKIINEGITRYTQKAFEASQKTRMGREIVKTFTGKGVGAYVYGREEANRKVESLIKWLKSNDPELQRQARRQSRAILYGKETHNVAERQTFQDMGLYDDLHRNYNKTVNNNRTTIINNHSENSYPSSINNKKRGDRSGTRTFGFEDNY